ncbi:MAG: hypothetical protein WA240_05430 [Nitrospirota bacterium]
MRKLSVLLVGIVLLSLGCITVKSYTKPGFDFSKIKKIAIVKLGSQVTLSTQHSTKSESQGSTKPEKADDNISQIVTDAIVMAFMQRGIDIVEANKLINENHFIQSGLTDTDRDVLSRAGVDALISGAISKRDTWKEKFLFSAKMYDIKTGEVIWSAFAHEIEGNDLDELPKAIAKSIKIKKRVEE